MVLPTVGWFLLHHLVVHTVPSGILVGQPGQDNSLSRLSSSGQWWRTPLIPALGRQRRADFWVRGQPGLQSEFQDSQGYTEKPCLKKTKQNKTKQNKTKTKKIWFELGMVVHTFNPSTWKAEAEDFWVQGQPGLQSEFQDSQGYTEKPCLEKPKKKVSQYAYIHIFIT